jgi:hypothetical protein
MRAFRRRSRWMPPLYQGTHPMQFGRTGRVTVVRVGLMFRPTTAFLFPQISQIFGHSSQKVKPSWPEQTQCTCTGSTADIAGCQPIQKV